MRLSCLFFTHQKGILQNCHQKIHSDVTYILYYNKYKARIMKEIRKVEGSWKYLDVKILQRHMVMEALA